MVRPVGPVSQLFAADRTWLRCALHAHTTESDGDLAPSDLVHFYEESGFDVLAITDHWVRTEPPPAERLLVIPSSELSCVAPEDADCHLLAFGIGGDPLEFVRSRPNLDEAARWVADHGGVAYLAHPYWSGLEPAAVRLPGGISGIEVYNAGCELETGRGLATVHWDALLERGESCLGIASDDTHHGRCDSLFAWVYVAAAERSSAAVVAALADGSFYSSMGPVVHELDVAADAVTITSSPCQRITLCSGRRRGSSVSAGPDGYRYRGEILGSSDDGEITSARLEWRHGASYGRVELVDAGGRKAWTNTLW
jgi:hypothetical protein